MVLRFQRFRFLKSATVLLLSWWLLFGFCKESIGQCRTWNIFWLLYFPLPGISPNYWCNERHQSQFYSSVLCLSCMLLQRIQSFRSPWKPNSKHWVKPSMNHKPIRRSDTLLVYYITSGEWRWCLKSSKFATRACWRVATHESDIAGIRHKKFRFDIFHNKRVKNSARWLLSEWKMLNFNPFRWFLFGSARIRYFRVTQEVAKADFLLRVMKNIFHIQQKCRNMFTMSICMSHYSERDSIRNYQ